MAEKYVIDQTNTKEKPRRSKFFGWMRLILVAIVLGLVIIGGFTLYNAFSGPKVDEVALKFARDVCANNKGEIQEALAINSSEGLPITVLQNLNILGNCTPVKVVQTEQSGDSAKVRVALQLTLVGIVNRDVELDIGMVKMSSRWRVSGVTVAKI